MGDAAWGRGGGALELLGRRFHCRFGGLVRQLPLHNVPHHLHRLGFDGAHVVLDVFDVEPVQQVDQSTTVDLELLRQFVHANSVFVRQNLSPQ
jgi:hypothetical protein